MTMQPERRSSLLQRLTLGWKAGIVTAIPVVLGVLILVGLQYTSLLAGIQESSAKGQSSIVELMAKRMAGGVKWRKTDAIQSVIDDVAKKDSSELADVIVLDSNGETLTAYQSSTLESAGDLPSLAAGLRPAAPGGKAGGLVAGSLQSHRIIAAPIGDDESGGMLLTAWDTKIANDRAFDAAVKSVGLGLVVLVLIVGAVGIFLSRAVIKPIVNISSITARLAGGDMNVSVPGGDRSDEIGDMARALEQIRTVGVKAARARSALDDASSPMMIVDMNGDVIFPNKAMNGLFADLSKSLGNELSGFTANEPDGVSFDTLHNLDPLRTANLMTLDRPIRQRMVASGRTIDLTASPVYNDAGDRLGAVVEWQDMTAQVAVETEVASIVHAASEGDFSQRLREADKSGFFADLSRGMNELLDAVDNGLGQVVKVVSALAEGDLTKRMQGEHKGAFAKLKDDADRMGERMEDMLSRIASVTSAVETATREISSGITDLSTRTEHQASSLEETTASMEELSATVRQNADNAQEANQVATAAREAAITGGDVTAKAVSAMSGIEESSKKITEIVSLIQEIAFQTNLLALNASVEAARAGEAGRGFSVVANEVRALAQRSAQASKDIRELISSSESRVQDGARLVNEAGSSLEEIVNSVKKVADYVSEIAAASKEQTSGLDQVNCAITSMDEMTQQNASLVEETTGAIQSARAQVSDLQEAVGFFRTDRINTAPPREAGKDDAPAANPVKTQQNRLARSIAAGSSQTANALRADEDWEEF